MGRLWKCLVYPSVLVLLVLCVIPSLAAEQCGVYVNGTREECQCSGRLR